ncbi:MAG: hypothetical protein WBH99_12480 [Azovibrio sp.]|uniref:hypothetical protein n=1 Tax=Azovibrio sp. TaxID=1872673 RepID=UPI003C7935AE
MASTPSAFVMAFIRPPATGAWIETTKRSIRNEPLIREDALRRALARMSQAQSQAWLVPQWLGSVQAALNSPWILAIDTPVKPLYGKQGGAQVSDDWWRVRPRPTWWDGGG